ncbi:MAG: Fic family protein [Cyanobacteria bacterium P01_C01_bin.69]
MPYQPPFEINARMVNQISVISELIGRLDGQSLQSSPQLRKQNRIQTIQGTLAIEGNTLSVEQVTAILEGKRVLGQPREIAEVQGSIRAYEALPALDPASVEDLKLTHQTLMSDILVNAGRFRRGAVGIHKGTQVVHVAPPAKRVPQLMDDLMSWVRNAEDHDLIRSCVFHYELEFIHPFEDGNGRMGRFWQTLILGQWNSLFYLLPIESLVNEQQESYYQTLANADEVASSTVFIEFMLDIVSEALRQNQNGQPIAAGSDQVSDQVKRLLSVMDDEYWSTETLMAKLSLSRKPTFRKHYLNPALEAGLVVMKYPQSLRSPKQAYKKVGI